jgi:hypothetical protein
MNEDDETQIKAQRLDSLHARLRRQYLSAVRDRDITAQNFTVEVLYFIETGIDSPDEWDQDAYEEFEERLHEDAQNVLIADHERAMEELHAY